MASLSLPRFRPGPFLLLQRGAAAALCVLAAASCEGPGSPARPDPSSVPRSDSGLGVALKVRPETFALGGDAEFALRTKDYGGYAVASILAQDARSLKALYCELEFDPARLSPVRGQPADRFAVPEECLSLLVSPAPGQAHYGQVLIHPDRRGGFSRAGVVATVRFDKRPQPRAVSAPPTSQAAAAQAEFDEAAGILQWFYACPGDSDQNGEVNIADLTPIGLHFGETGPFDWSGLPSVIDGDGNAEINISDLTPIGANYGVHFDAYHAYSSTTVSEAPLDPSSLAGLQDNGARALSDSVVAPNEGRMRFELKIDAPQPDAYYWVYPREGGEYGSASTTAGGPALDPGNNKPPAAALTADKFFGAPGLIVNFDAGGSSDPDGDLLTYAWDMDGDDVLEQPASQASTFQYTFTKSGYQLARVFVNDGTNVDQVASTYIGIFATQNIPPHLNPSLVGSEGLRPLTVAVQPQAIDGDGAITQVEWDWENDGVFEESGSASAEMLHVYSVAGAHTLRIRCTDNEGATDESTLDFTVPEMNWAVQTIDLSLDDVGRAVSLALINGRPAVAYYDDSEDRIMYRRAGDANGAAWGTVRVLASLADDGRYLSLAQVAERPAIAFTRHRPSFPAENGDLMYVRANDGTGASWPAARPVGEGFVTGYGVYNPDQGQYCSLAVVAGRPAISFHRWGFALHYMAANDTTGDSWPAQFPSLIAGGGDLGQGNVLLNVDDKPLVLFYDGLFYYSRGLRSYPSADIHWSRSGYLSYAVGPRWIDGGVFTGLPCALFRDQSANALKFLRAGSADGLDWNPALAVVVAAGGNGAGAWGSLASIGGRPAAAYYREGPHTLHFKLANDASGATWPATDLTVDSGGDVGKPCDLLTLPSGWPAIAYYDQGNGNLKYARLI